jgi:hypothetical protein
MGTKLDNNHLALLALFLRPRPLDAPTWQGLWSAALGEPYDRAIRSFTRQGLLAEANPTFELRLEYLRVADIKPILKQHGLKVSGKRDELLARLLEALPQEARRLTQALDFRGQYVCTPAGRALAEAYKESVARDQQKTEEEVRQALRRGDCRRAAGLVQAFRDRQPAPMGGAGLVHADSLWAEAILAIKSAPQTTAEELEVAKLTAAEDAIWGRRLTGPKHLLPAAYTAMFAASNRRTLMEMRQSGVVKKVSILASSDSCDSCRELDVKGPYPLNKVPTIPNPQCMHPIGWCRCTYVAET